MVSAASKGSAPRPYGMSKAQILDVALDLISEQGFAATSVREIADRLSVTNAALYYHFRTKDDLLRALISPVLEQLEDLIGEPIPTGAAERRDALARYTRILFENLALLRVLAEDPSIRKSSVMADVAPMAHRLNIFFSGQAKPSPALRIQTRAALGAISGAVHRMAPDEPEALVASVALEAAARALGIATG